ncbi:MAG: thiolase domain-containing protein [Thermodesulfobacteriota bacterium]|nr:thiolase domain-containing protein [Thermodesulfobacteriota bacterium]
MAERVAVIGVGQTEFKGRWPEISEVEMVNLAVRRALEDARLTIEDIDLVLTGNMETFEGNYLVDMWLVEGDGAYMKSGMKVQSGGTTGSTVTVSAFDFAATGQFNSILAIAFEKQDEGNSQAALRNITEDVFWNVGGGGLSAITAFQGLALDMLERGSVTEEHVARIRVKEAECASLNPYAHLRKKLTIDRVMNSPMLAWPIRFLHSCPTSVGVCAMIVAPEGVAKKISSDPAWVVDWVTVRGGSLERIGAMGQAQRVGPLGPCWAWSVEQSATQIYKRNGIANPRRELDVVEVYDMSTWSEIEWYERLHLCERNQAWKLIDEEATNLGGDIPVNPSGGVVSTNAIGASAMQRFAEAALQIRSKAGEHQVPDAKVAIAVSAGGDNYSSAGLIKKSLD